MPTAASVYFTNQKLEPAMRNDQAIEINVRLPASVNYPQGCLLGELAATPGTFKAYSSGNSDGSQLPKAILPYAIATDAGGNITLTGTSGQAGGEFGQQYASIDVYIGGYFRAEDLPQSGTGAIDANALATGQLIQKQGGIAGGIVRLL